MAMVNLGSKPIGSIVLLKENGVPTEYLVVHQGIPHAMYDPSCNGTWLLRKIIPEQRQWNSGMDNRYASSEIHAYLNNVYINSFEATIKNAIKQVKIPYGAGFGSAAVYSGASGLSCKLFLLGIRELGMADNSEYHNYSPIDGAKLAYFDYGDQNQEKRVAYYIGKAVNWYLRSCNIKETEYVHKMSYDGSIDSSSPATSNSYGIRPALIMPSNVYVIDDGAVVTNAPPSVPASLSVPNTVQGGKALAISWGAATDTDGNLAGYQLERSVNSGGWGLIYQGTALAHTDTITFGWNTVAYRVRAYDSVSAFSSYQTSATRTVFNNQPPAISGTDGSLGVKTGAFSTAYTVSDANPGQAVTVVETLNGIHRRTFNVTNLLACSFDVTANEWRELLNGSHTIKTTATDASGVAVARTFTFQKNETQIEVQGVVSKIPTERPTEGMLTLTRQIPEGSNLIVEACNNARDAAPTWTDVSVPVLAGRKFFLSNTNKTAAQWGLGFRIRINRLGVPGECWISAIGGNFK